MKADEYKMLLGSECEIPAKRKEYILKKWCKKGWLNNGEYTDEFNRVRDLAINKKKYIPQWDGRVVIVCFLEEYWKIPDTVGILEDHGDNGWHLFTAASSKGNWSYFLDYYEFKDIAYVDLHPKPRKIWTKLNYVFWKYNKREDRFHKKIGTHSYGTVCDYSRASEGIFTYTHPLGKIGDCFPCCQCKMLGDKC